MKNKIGLSFSIGVCVVTFTLGLQVPPASAQNANKPTLVSAAPQKQSSTEIKTASAAAATPAESAGKGYYIEFRARNSGKYQVPIGYVWQDELATGELGPQVPLEAARTAPEPEPTAAV